MELKKRLDFRKVLVVTYFAAFIVYLIIGLQPAGAKEYEISTELLIPGINLISDVTEISLTDRALEAPEEIVGSFSKYENKTLLIGHSSTVFKNLDETKVGDSIIYNQKKYRIAARKILAKHEIKMTKLLAGASRDTVVIMTCAGGDLGNGDATHRLIITALIE